MKSMFKFLVAHILFAFTVSAFASTGYYGLPKAKPAAANPGVKATQYSNVVLRNFTNDDYTAQAYFRPSGAGLTLFLGRYGTGQDVITYDINYPDYDVCVNVVRNFDGAPIYSGCQSYGYIDIGPFMAKNKPQVKVTK